MNLRQLAYVEGLKEFVVLARMKPLKLADRLRDPFKVFDDVQDLEAEIEKRIEQASEEKREHLHDLLHLVHTYNESHAPFERLKYVAGLPDWLTSSKKPTP